MKFYISAIIMFSFLLSAIAKPGGRYILTGREKSIFAIFQADMKAYPELYKDEDINACYQEFKAINNLDGRKLIKGEELILPHTIKSKALEDAEKAEAMAAAAREREKERTASNPEGSEDHLELFGSDTRKSPAITREEAEKARQKSARQKAVRYFQHTRLPSWLSDPGNMAEYIEKENMDALTQLAQVSVDEPFAEALVMHSYPEKNIYVLEFEKPTQVENLFFLAIEPEASGRPHLYSLEKGISFFGAGDLSNFAERKTGREFSTLGGREYIDLASFLKEIEAARAEPDPLQ